PGPVSAAAEPRKGGAVRIGMGDASTTDSLDPATMLADYIYTVSWAARNNLTEVAPTGDVVPELAESWEASADLTTWTFRLRRGIEFHSGKTMTADDVIASINHHRGEASKSAVKALLTDIVEIAKDGNDIVRFRLNRANADFPPILTAPHINIMPSDESGRAITSGIGTGGYVIQSFDPGVRTVLTRNRNYWKTGRAHFDSAEILAINDATARSNALRSGSIDIMHRCDTKTVSLLAKLPGIRVVSV